MSKSLSNLFFFFVIAGSFFLFATPASAATYWWVGGTTNNNTSNPANWSTSSGACANSANTVLPTTGDMINFGSACKNDAIVDSPLTVAVLSMLSGYTGTTTVSASMTVTSQLLVDGGILYISNGGIVTGPPGTNGIMIGNSATGNGTVIVTGSGSQLIQTTVGDTRLRIGNSTGGIGKLYILNGATANTGSIYAAYSPGTTAEIIVDGAGTVWNSDIAGRLGFIGRSGTASLTVSNGAVVNSIAGPLQIGGFAGSVGSITVTGTGSQLNFVATYNNPRVGFSGTGSLTVQDGAVVNSPGLVTIAALAGSTGTLTIGTGYTTDVIRTSSIVAGLGTALLPPIATTTITGTATSETSIEWDWDDVIGATGYKIYRASDNVLLATINSTTSNWTQEGLSPNTAYQIYYRGTNAQGEGLAAATSTAYTAAKIPNVPTVTNESPVSQRIILNVNGNPSSTEFSIYNATLGKYIAASGALSDSPIWQTYSSWGGSAGIVATNLSENTKHTYRVFARNGANVSTNASADTSAYTQIAADLPNFTKAMDGIKSRTKSNAIIAIIGDSWTAGYHFVPFMYDYVNNNFPAGVGYVPVDSYPYNVPLDGATKESTGSWTNTNGSGGLGPNISHTTSYDTITPASKSVTCSGTQFKVLYLKKSGGGTFEYSIDGGAATAVNTSNASNALGLITISAAENTSHTITMTVKNAGTTGVTLFGVECINANAHGVVLQKLGMSGARAARFAAAPAALWQSEISALSPDLVIISLGTNDIANTTVNDYIANIETIIANVKAANSNTDILLVPPAVGTRTGPAGDVSAYYAPLQTLAEDNGYGYLQAGDAIGPYETASAAGLWFDGVHLSQTGDKIFANEILKYLGLYQANSSLYTAIHPPTQLYTTSESNSVTAKVNIFPNDTVGQSGYYFSRSGGGSSGWIQTNSWTDTGLSCGQEYVYSVKYRNADGVETSEMSTTKSTSGCIGGGYTEQWAFPMVPAYGFKVNNKEQPTTTAPTTTGVFTKYLQFKQTHADVRRLQMFLNSDPDTKIAGTGAGSPGKETDYFGVLTYRAVIKFQEKYAKDILTPWGFTKGTGYVGKTTLSKINELISGK